MEKRLGPYIGVSGVASPAQEFAVMRAAFDTGASHERRLMLGVKATHKTQYLDMSNKYGEDYFPVGNSFKRVLVATDLARLLDRDALFVAQVYIEPELIGDPTYREDFIDKVLDRGWRWTQGIQFDHLPWQRDPAMLDFLLKVRRMDYAPSNVLLQCHASAMEALGPKEAAKRLGDFALSGAINYVLFDASHGKGKRLDGEQLRPYLDEAYGSSELAGVGFGIAGGLDGQVVRQSLPPLIAAYPDLSWDAEGKLHPMQDDGSRPLDMVKVADYLLASAGVIGG